MPVVRAGLHEHRDVGLRELGILFLGALILTPGIDQSGDEGDDGQPGRDRDPRTGGHVGQVASAVCEPIHAPQ